MPTFIKEVEIETEYGTESVEIWRLDEGGLVGIDTTYLDQVTDVIFDPYNGNSVTLPEDSLMKKD